MRDRGWGVGRGRVCVYVCVWGGRGWVGGGVGGCREVTQPTLTNYIYIYIHTTPVSPTPRSPGRSMLICQQPVTHNACLKVCGAQKADQRTAIVALSFCKLLKAFFGGLRGSRPYLEI